MATELKLTAANDEWLALISEQHLYQGLCPDSVEGWDSRDPECDACTAVDLIKDVLWKRGMFEDE